MKKVLRWLKSRLLEKSTYTGIAVVASVLGAREAGVAIDQIGTAVALIAGGGLVAATTREG